MGGCGGRKWQNQAEFHLGTRRNQTWRSFCIFACFFCFKITPQNPYPSNQDFNFYLGINESLLPFLSPFFLSQGTNCMIATFFFFFKKHSIASNKIRLQKNKNGFLSLYLPVNAEEQKWVSLHLWVSDVSKNDTCGLMGIS
jgi:hypothetical protein